MRRRLTRRLKRRTAAIATAAVVLALVGSGLALAAAEENAPSAAPAVCAPPGQALSGVYHPGRLRVLDGCTSAAGRIALVKHELDGDVHLLVNLDQSDRHLLDQGNGKVGGNLVVELMPRDAGHIAEPAVGDQVRLVGAWVHDGWHNWNEIHPVWAMSTNGGSWQLSGPQDGGAPAASSPYSAARDCRTASGARCAGYTAG
jgi:hypothetical protein